MKPIEIITVQSPDNEIAVWRARPLDAEDVSEWNMCETCQTKPAEYRAKLISSSDGNTTFECLECALYEGGFASVTALLPGKDA